MRRDTRAKDQGAGRHIMGRFEGEPMNGLDGNGSGQRREANV